MGQAIQVAPRRRLERVFADRYGLDEAKVLNTLKATAFRVSDKSGVEVSDEQMTALLIVADQYKLNPWTKEIYAFPDRNGIVPVVSIDGWARIINEHPQLDGIEFEYAPEIVARDHAKPCPEWCQVILTRKDRSKPIIVREYLDEVFRDTAPWKSHTKRMLRHKALIQGARIAFGFAGIYDEDEAARIIEGTASVEEPSRIEGPRPKEHQPQPPREEPKASPRPEPGKQEGESASNQKVKMPPSAQKTLEQILRRCGYLNSDGTVDPSPVLVQFNLDSMDQIDTPDLMNQVIEWVSTNRRERTVG